MLSLSVTSKTVVTEHKFLYGPSLSENEACEKAIIEVKKKAISTESETLSSESVMLCDERATDELCKNYRDDFDIEILTTEFGGMRDLEFKYDSDIVNNICICRDITAHLSIGF